MLTSLNTGTLGLLDRGANAALAIASEGLLRTDIPTPTPSPPAVGGGGTVWAEPDWRAREWLKERRERQEIAEIEELTMLIRALIEVIDAEFD